MDPFTNFEGASQVRLPHQFFNPLPPPFCLLMRHLSMVEIKRTPPQRTQQRPPLPPLESTLSLATKQAFGLYPI